MSLVKNLDIDVCRLAGTINVQNVVGTTEVEAEMQSDNVGHFSGSRQEISSIVMTL